MSDVHAGADGARQVRNAGSALHVADVRRAGEALAEAIATVLVGLEPVVHRLAVALMADGHVLLEEVPGTGKTTLAKAIARCLGLNVARIQLTPDLLPSDVTGLYWFNQAESRFELRRGPIFAHVVLADEINRATPRTQSALLEAMAEHQVTVEGHTLALPEPFLVLATQNPVELEGTFPLPEAQVDRFLMRLRLGYPDQAQEDRMLLLHGHGDPLAALKPLDSWRDRVPALRDAVAGVRVHDDVRAYLLALTRATREHERVELGVSPRGSLLLFRASRAAAALAGRDFVLPDDVKAVAVPVLAHRLVVEAGAALRGTGGEEIVEELLERVPVPLEPEGA